MEMDMGEGFRKADDRKKEKDRPAGFILWWRRTVQSAGWLLFLAAVATGVILMLPSSYQDPVFAWLGYERKVEEPAPPPEPVKVAAVSERKGDAIVFSIEGLDANGRKAAFDVLILTKDYNWVKGSTTDVVKGEETLTEAALIERIFTQEVRDLLGKATDVIAVGVASQEGQPEAEIARAENRAKTAAAWLTAVVPAETAVWMLNFGQYQTCPAAETSDTSFQRPLILIGVHSKDEGADLSEALANAIGGKTNLPSRDCYSRFDFVKLR